MVLCKKTKKTRFRKNRGNERVFSFRWKGFLPTLGEFFLHARLFFLSSHFSFHHHPIFTSFMATTFSTSSLALVLFITFYLQMKLFRAICSYFLITESQLCNSAILKYTAILRYVGRSSPHWPTYKRTRPVYKINGPIIMVHIFPTTNFSSLLSYKFF